MTEIISKSRGKGQSGSTTNTLKKYPIRKTVFFASTFTRQNKHPNSDLYNSEHCGCCQCDNKPLSVYDQLVPIRLPIKAPISFANESARLVCTCLNCNVFGAV